ncbi:MAG: Crp/Fnr family transcriptional regulator [Candidatus Melainabacteria bacterium]|nr:Crp/Fnr family transcriptional regulator [Candidatus Melainabacteria bacterium]
MMSPATSPHAAPLSPEEKRAATLKKLRTIKLFQSLSDDALIALAPHFHDHHYDKETIVFHESDLPSETGCRVYFVLDGCVKLVKYSTDGESTIVRLATIGEFFGVTGALTNKPLPFSAVALTDTNVIYADREHFVDMVRQHPQISLDMIVALGEVLWFNYETHNQVVKKTDARVAKILLYHLRRDGAEETPGGLQLKIQLPHEYIASMTGIAYEESVRIISRLKKQYNCIQYLRGGKIVLTDVDTLKKLTQDYDAWGT